MLISPTSGMIWHPGGKAGLTRAFQRGRPMPCAAQHDHKPHVYMYPTKRKWVKQLCLKPGEISESTSMASKPCRCLLNGKCNITAQSEGPGPDMDPPCMLQCLLCGPAGGCGLHVWHHELLVVARGASTASASEGQLWPHIHTEHQHCAI